MPPTLSKIRAVLEMPAIPIQSPSQVINRAERSEGSGLFSTFTSYLSSYAADDPPEPSDEEINDTLCTIDCLHACPLESIFTNLMYVYPLRDCKDANKIRTIPSESLTALVHALLDHLPEDSAPVVITVKPDPSSPGLPKPNGHRTNPGALVYDPSVLYILELSTLLAIRDEASTVAVGKDVAETLQNIVRAAADTHPLTVSRAVYYLLHLLDASHVSKASAGSLPLADIERNIHSFELQ